MKFISIQQELPTPYKLVAVKRKTGHAYVGYRNDQPISTNTDPSRECHWWGNPKSEAFDIEAGTLKFHNNFSDVTVDSWSYLTIDETALVNEKETVNA